MKEKNTLVFGTPKSINLIKLFSDAQIRDKVIFIIHQLNFWTKKSGEYNFSNQVHINFLNLESAQFMEIKNTLIKKRLIKQINKSENYVLVKPFDINDNKKCIQHTFNLGEDNCPEFIKKWVEYGHRMKKPLDVQKETSNAELKKQIEVLLKENIRLKEQVLANDISIKSYPELYPAMRII